MTTKHFFFLYLYRIVYQRIAFQTKSDKRGHGKFIIRKEEHHIIFLRVVIITVLSIETFWRHHQSFVQVTNMFVTLYQRPNILNSIENNTIKQMKEEPNRLLDINFCTSEWLWIIFKNL